MLLEQLRDSPVQLRALHGLAQDQLLSRKIPEWLEQVTWPCKEAELLLETFEDSQIDWHII